jgi:hypothetical protein
VWFAEAIVSAGLVAADMRHTPESPVVKWGFVIVTLYTGPVGLVPYLWSCREPLPGTHEEYVRARWRRVVGSTMDCVAGDGLGILLAATVTAPVGLPAWADLLVEYAAGWAASRCDTSSPSGSAKPVVTLAMTSGPRHAAGDTRPRCCGRPCRVPMTCASIPSWSPETRTTWLPAR